jgi:hypothetical protein
MGPSVRPGKPPEPNIDRFNHLIVEGIDLYLSKSLFIPAPFTIALWRFFWLKGLTVEGWKII